MADGGIHALSIRTRRDPGLPSSKACRDVLIRVHLRQTYRPTVSDEDRYTVSFVNGLPNAYRILLRYGYNEPHQAINAAAGLVDALAAFLDEKRSSGPPEAKRVRFGREGLEVLFKAKRSKEPVYRFGREVLQNRCNAEEKKFSGAFRGFVCDHARWHDLEG